jgi:aminodeoxyfutalosine synthase
VYLGIAKTASISEKRLRTADGEQTGRSAVRPKRAHRRLGGVLPLDDRAPSATLAAIAEKVHAGERLTFDEGTSLYACDDLAWLGGLAHEVRTRKNGDAAYFNVNRHLNLTNVCTASCAYCSFQRKPGEPEAYTMRVEEAVRLAKEMEPAGITELHIVNGLHPTLPWKYYPRALRELKAALPDVALKAFTATEIHWFERISGLPADEVLDELIDAGLESLTGGGAEIFDWEIRSQIVDHATHWEDWSRIHRIAHSKGLRTPCTMLYGHIEEPRHRVDHVIRLRELQDETGGFSVFIPLRYQHDAVGDPRNRLMDRTTMATGAEALKTFAVSRLLFDNIDHIKCFWVMHGLTTGQLALSHGADDLDGSVVEYKITHDADGFGTPNEMTRDDLLELIRDAGFTPVERDTRYRVLRTYPGPDPERREVPQAMAG